jgi:purine nucleoside permease
MILILAFTLPAQAQSSTAKPIEVKVVIIAMFEPGEDTGDTPGEYQLWVEREHLDKVIDLPAAYHHVRMNDDGLLAMLTGVGTAKAAASVMALGLDPRFDLSHAYFIVAGIGGGDPADVSLGSAVWADRVIDSDLAYEIDAREIPKNWTTGYLPLRRATPYELPVPTGADAAVYTLNPQLVHWAFALTKDTQLADTDGIRQSRARFANFPNATKPPFVTHGDTLSGSTFWHGSLFDRWANDWVKYFTAGAGNFMVAGMEDTGTLQSLTFLGQAGRIDIHRVLVLRTISNFDQQAPGTSAADSIQQITAGRYAAYMESLNAAQQVADKVVRDIIAHWPERKAAIPQ